MNLKPSRILTMTTKTKLEYFCTYYNKFHEFNWDIENWGHRQHSICSCCGACVYDAPTQASNYGIAMFTGDHKESVPPTDKESVHVVETRNGPLTFVVRDKM